MKPGQTVPIIVGGFFRSGTSLVRRLLDSHSRIHCGPEVKFFRDFYGQYPRDDLAHARFFSTVRSLGLDDEELLRLFGAAFIQAHVRAAAKAGKARWADKNPENVIFLRHWELLLPDGFFFVHVVRNPLDVLASLKETGFPKMLPAEVGERAALYANYRRAGEEFARKHPGRSFTLDYESLVADPARVLSELFDFLGERFEPGVLTSFNDPQRGQGLEDPKVSRTREIHRLSVDRWRTELTVEEVATARVLLGDWLELAIKLNSQ